MHLTTPEATVAVAAAAAVLPLVGAWAQQQWARRNALQDHTLALADQKQAHALALEDQQAQRRIDLTQSASLALIDECSDFRVKLQRIPPGHDVDAATLQATFQRIDRLRARLPDTPARAVLVDCSEMLWYALTLTDGSTDPSPAKILAWALSDYITDIAGSLAVESPTLPAQPDWYAAYLDSYRAISDRRPPEATDATAPPSASSP